MRVTLQSTDRIVAIGTSDNLVARVWEGTTESGIEIIAMVPRIAVKADEDLSQFEAELAAQQPPQSIHTDAWPNRVIL